MMKQKKPVDLKKFFKEAPEERQKIIDFVNTFRRLGIIKRSYFTSAFTYDFFNYILEVNWKRRL